jgi:hypothetical protein
MREEHMQAQVEIMDLKSILALNTEQVLSFFLYKILV